MPTTTEIRQKLIQGGISPANAQAAALILADVSPIPPPSGGIWDTLTAKNYIVSLKPANVVFRYITNGVRNGIVTNFNGINTLYMETDISTL